MHPFAMPLERYIDPMVSYNRGTLAAHLYRLIRQLDFENHATFWPEPDKMDVSAREAMPFPTEKGLATHLVVGRGNETWSIDGRLPTPREEQGWSNGGTHTIVNARQSILELGAFEGTLYPPRSESAGPYLDVTALTFERYSMRPVLGDLLNMQVDDPEAQPAHALQAASAATLALCLDPDTRPYWQIA